jgi:hypothetical protein
MPVLHCDCMHPCEHGDSRMACCVVWPYRVIAWEPVPYFAAFFKYALLRNNLTHLVEVSTCSTIFVFKFKSKLFAMWCSKANYARTWGHACPVSVWGCVGGCVGVSVCVWGGGRGGAALVTSHAMLCYDVLCYAVLLQLREALVSADEGRIRTIVVPSRGIWGTASIDGGVAGWE